MEFSFKQVAVVILSILMFSLALNSMLDEFKKQGSMIEANTKTSYSDYEQQLNTQGVVVNAQRKPQKKDAIFHMRKGDYSMFSYHSLIQAIDFQGNTITDVREAVIDGHILGAQEGVNILYCSVFDKQGNYLRYKIAVIIEGNAMVSDVIKTYEEGKLV